MSSLIKSGLIVSLFVLAGRLTGFGREWLLAFRGGASEHTDIAIVLLTFPDLVVNLLLGGGLTAALVPAYRRLGPGGDTALLLQASRIIGGVFVLLALSIAILALPTLSLLAPGLSEATRESFVWHFRLVTLSLPMAALSGAVVALLNSRERFALGAAGTLIFNLSVITSLLVLPPTETVTAIAAGALIGAGLRLATQTWGLKPVWTPPIGRHGLIDRTLVAQFLGSFSFLTVLVILPPLARAFSSLDDAGSLSLFNYAYKLVELPMGVVIGSIVTVLLPRLAADLPQGSAAAGHASLAAGLRFTLLFSLIIAIPSIFFADVLVHIAFFSASLSADQFDTLAALASIGFMALPFQAMLNVYASAFAASGHTRPLLLTAIFMLSCVAILAPNLQAKVGLSGVMMSYGIAYLAGTLLLTWHTARHFGSATLRSALRHAPTSIVLPAGAGLGVAYLGSIMGAASWSRLLWACLTVIVMLTIVILSDQRLRAACMKRIKGHAR